MCDNSDEIIALRKDMKTVKRILQGENGDTEDSIVFQVALFKMQMNEVLIPKINNMNKILWFLATTLTGAIIVFVINTLVSN